jgi:hypothetical protein
MNIQLVIVRESGRSSIQEAGRWNREAAAYWIARSSRTTTSERNGAQGRCRVAAKA